MSAERTVLFRVRGILPVMGAVDDFKPCSINPQGEQLVTQVMPPSSELVRQGASWQVVTTTAAASVIAAPTTASILTIYNGEPDTGRAIIIDAITCFQAGAAAALNNFAIWVMQQKLKPAAAPASGPTIRGLMGQAYTGKAIAAALVLGLTNDTWQPFGNSQSNVVNSLGGAQIDVPTNGIFIIKPGFQMHFNCVASATTLTVMMGVRAHEVQLLLGA